MQMSACVSRALAGLGVLLVLAGSGCDRYGPTIDLDGRKPDHNAGMSLHVSWQMVRQPVFDHLDCHSAGAAYVLTTLDGGSPRTFRARCDFPSPEAWIPIEAGRYVARGELIDDAGHRLSRTKDLTLEAQAGTSELVLPYVFAVN
jgi:hypothetical protein